MVITELPQSSIPLAPFKLPNRKAGIHGSSATSIGKCSGSSSTHFPSNVLFGIGVAGFQNILGFDVWHFRGLENIRKTLMDTVDDSFVVILFL